MRGLLCTDCNLMLGHAKDDIERLERAKQYLTQHSGSRLKVVKSVGGH